MSTIKTWEKELAKLDAKESESLIGGGEDDVLLADNGDRFFIGEGIFTINS